MPSKHSAYFGPAMMLLAALFFSTGGLLCKLIPWSPLTINGVRSLLSLTVFASYLKLTHHKLRCNRTILFGALCMIGMSTLYIVANKTTTAANAIILQYAAPIWIILFLALFFHTKPTKRDLITCAFVFFGIIFFFLDSLSSGNMMGNLFAIGSGIFYAGMFLLNQFPDGDAISSMVIGQIVSSIFMAPLVIHETVFTPPTLAAVLVLSIVQVGLAYVCFSIGIKYTPPVSASLIASIEPVLNPILVAVFCGEMITPLSLIGAAIVLLAILIYNIIGALSTKQQGETAVIPSD